MATDEPIGSAAALSAQGAVNEPTAPGPHAVRIADRELAGPAGPLPVRVHYPDGPGPFPAIVFSHGLGGSRLGYGYLGKSWASHGYAVVHPTHRQTSSELQGGRRLLAIRALLSALDDPRNWVLRAKEVSAVIDQLDALSASVPALKGKIDERRVGVAGHSLGAWTALAVAGAAIHLDSRAPEGEEPTASGPRAPADPHALADSRALADSHALADSRALADPHALADPRPRAFVALSPTGYGVRGLRDSAWSSVTRPLLAMTGTLDVGMHGKPVEWRTRPFLDLPPGGKVLVLLEEAEHVTFAGGNEARPARTAHLRVIEEATAAFWDAELKGDERARALLQPGHLERPGEPRVHLQFR